jgi:adenosyl cobinamide kinase/adenosyl cobinamide phosphate guanylyltransferase
MIVLLIGGARSGKSELALDLAERAGGAVTFLATGEARDDEMAARIERHKKDRNEAWTTLEEPIELTKALESTPEIDVVVLDCLTLWAANLMERGFDTAEVVARADVAARVCASRARPVIVVTNEVGSGIVPDNKLARDYRDLLGTINATFAEHASRVLFVSAGRVAELKDTKEIDIG